MLDSFRRYGGRDIRNEVQALELVDPLLALTDMADQIGGGDAEFLFPRRTR